MINVLYLNPKQWIFNMDIESEIVCGLFFSNYLELNLQHIGVQKS